MRNIIIGLIICAVSNDHVFGNVVLLEQDIAYAFEPTEEETIQQSSLDDTNGNINIKAEPYTDLNNNGEYDYAEKYLDDNQNGIWDNDEPYTDLNNNGEYDYAESFQDLNQNSICDIQEPFIDKGNGIYDVGEEFVDVNNNKVRDLELWYVDRNKNEKWDKGEPFEDLNNDGIKGYNESFTDINNNNKYDAPEEIGETKFTFSAITFIELFFDMPNGRYDLGEEYEDLNSDGKWTPGEEYEDLNSDGKWTPAEEYEDLNSDGKWTGNNEQNDLNDKNILNSYDVEPSMYDTLMLSKQSLTLNNKNDVMINSSLNHMSFKSPGKALLYSGILPGMGQVYMKKWQRGLLFVALDGIAIGTMYHNDILAEEKEEEYINYANEHWDFGRWIHDYYKWYEYKEGDSAWNAIREVFINYSDSTSGCAQDPTEGKCYADIWGHSHKVEFTYDESIMSSSSDDFKQVFKDLCGNSYIFDRDCSNEVVSLYDNNGDTINVIKSHHFYEGIQKYDMFFAGWDDNDSVFVVTKQHGDKNATSSNQIAYRSLWSDYNKIKTLAGHGGKFMLINRVVSMVDALLLAKKWNNKYNVQLSINAYPDLRNKSGLGGVKLSLHFR